MGLISRGLTEKNARNKCPKIQLFTNSPREKHQIEAKRYLVRTVFIADMQRACSVDLHSQKGLFEEKNE